MADKLKSPPKSKKYLSSPEVLRSALNSLIGTPFKLTGKPKTDGSKMRKLISETLTLAGLPIVAENGTFSIMPPKKKGVPKILLELIDTYLVTSGDSYNLQVWNRIPNSKSVLVDFFNNEPLQNCDVRYVLVKINIDNHMIESIVILSAEQIEANFGIFGKQTIKHQLLISNIIRNKIIESYLKIAFASDTEAVKKISTNIYSKPDLDLGDPVNSSKLFSLELIRDRVAKEIIGKKNSSNDTKTRGQSLEKMVAGLLGYDVENNKKLVGGYPDIPNQLLEVKVQDAPTVDLGKYTPEIEDIINENMGLKTSDVRYLIALTNSETNIIEGVVLMPGAELGSRYTYVSDTNYKCQRSIPMDFFSSIKGMCVVNPPYQKLR